MSFNPHKVWGIPLDRQLRHWSELNVTLYDMRSVDLDTRCRAIAMNSIEVEASPPLLSKGDEIMMSKTFAALALAGTTIALPLGATAQTPPPPPPAMGKVQASAYVMAAGRSDLYEIDSSQIAVKRSKSRPVPAHEAALDLLQSYARGGDQAPLRASAKAAVPIVKRHLDAAKRLQSGASHPGHGGK